MTEEQRKAIDNLRARGFAVTVFNPEELQGADRRDIENAMVREGNESIEVLKPYSTEEVV